MRMHMAGVVWMCEVARAVGVEEEVARVVEAARAAGVARAVEVVVVRVARVVKAARVVEAAGGAGMVKAADEASA